MQSRRGRPSGGLLTKRTAIIEAATATLLREGYERATVDGVAAAAGVSKQTVYNHFGDKERLFQATIDAVQAAAAAEVQAFLDELLGDGDLRAVLLEVGRRWLPLLLRPDLSALRRLVIFEVERHPELREAWQRGGPRQLRSRLADHLARRALRGELAIDDPDRAAGHLMALVSGEAQERSRFGTVPLPAAEMDEIVTAGVTVFLRAYGA
jgi:TetR/AcrR family transcriptional repressor of mexJK operon